MAEMTEPPEMDIGSAKRQGATVRTGDGRVDRRVAVGQIEA